MINKHNRQKGLTLIELQIGAVIMMVLLVATGVIFYFALNSLRFMQDAFTVYSNAQSAMKAISQEVMKANRYGWVQGPTWSPPANSVYSAGGTDLSAFPDMPTLGTEIISSSWWGGYDPVCLYLRQDEQPDFLGPAVDPQADDYTDDQITLIQYHSSTGEIRIESAIGPIAPNQSAGFVVARNVSKLDFRKISFNALMVELEVTGKVLEPVSGEYTVAKIYTVLNLRCAPADTCEPWAGGPTNDNW
ncbi:MAG: hypothetical protein KKB82_02655 [Candidatus Omnitrophica bacterium]|nr:hypothetical protein [Candidatus Omnitrophota bacterium]MBU1924806.1 hypothetical protein [Candidatus Omnitrophota bacterium]